jgi:hypothetical protein
MGCVKESTTGQRHEFSFAWWGSAEMALIGIGSTVACWSCRNASVKGARAAFIGAFAWPILFLLMVPSQVLHRVVVDDAGFSIRQGIWGATTYEKKFANLAKIRLISQHSGGRSVWRSYYLECRGKSGSFEKIPMHYAVYSEVAKQAMPLILKRARERGVIVVDDS